MIYKHFRLIVTYTVHLHRNRARIIITNFEKKSIRLTLKRYTSDQHIKGAFRHFMEINDDIFPEQWKNAVSLK